MPTYYVSKETRRYVTVALNGDGGDESFAGYDRYQAMVLAESHNRLPAFLRDGLRRASMSLIPEELNF
ncbi:MAG: asparagine synthetase B, partial [Candidatus Aenigmarchaeota archaeon]|nr:asparagine synthetase B [Candidatus Aenigmarchaeota archaeon]